MHAIALLFTLLTNHASQEAALQPGAAHRYELRLRRGESADVVVQQKGIDVVVDIRGPGGALLDEIDGPTGRNGDERAEIIAAESGTYTVTVRPYDEHEPAGRYRIEVAEVRSAAATRAMLEARAVARGRATAWLRAYSAPLSPDAPPLAALAARARVIGLGEATHGSREFGDVRLALTRRLIEEHGVRVVAVEWSSSHLAALAPYVAGESPAPAVAESGWIGRRTMRELVAALRAWNAAHPADRVRLVGVDAQDNALAREELRAFLGRAYGDLLPRWNAAEKELAAADEQSAVFGDSSVKVEVRQTLFELVARLSLDAALLRARYGAAADRALTAARTLASFADFNSSAADSRSRDWAMAGAVLRALAEAGPGARAVYWAHNAHVRVAEKTSGGFLRAALGCGYAAVAQTFGEGSFVAQVPNDVDDRLAVSMLPQAADESIESVLAPVAGGPILAAWPCGDAAPLPEWLRAAHAIHWVGALWTPGSAPSAATRPFNLVHDFDGVVYLPRVTADEIPTDRPHVPPRQR
jgi:erythromycin esterase